MYTRQFPFGQPVRALRQQDCTHKHVFVLGVYASAVHARWLDQNGKTLVNALAVASEPCIFWTGDPAETEVILNRIALPSGLGRLVPANSKLNGPSGRALDEAFLAPLGLDRSQVWLCDLVPHSCMNVGQKRAIERQYMQYVERGIVESASVPELPHPLVGDTRRAEILEEIQKCDPRVIVLLGDEPIRWFLKCFDPRWRKLSDFGTDAASYGRLHLVQIDGRSYCVLPLAHPRQANRLGPHSSKWYTLHQQWAANGKPQLLASGCI